MGLINFKHKYKSMGGAATKPIECGAYTTPDAVEADYELYANSVVITGADLNQWSLGLLFVPWAVLLMWLMNGWIVNYFSAMNDILQCGLQYEVESKYGQAFFETTFTPVYQEVMDHAATVNVSWHPGIWYSLMWICNVLYFISPHVTWWSLFFLTYFCCYACFVCPCCCYGYTFLFLSFIFTCGWCFCGYLGLGFLCCYLIGLILWLIFAVFGFVFYYVAWYLLSVLCFGLPQLLLAMNYAAFWDEKGQLIGGTIEAPAAAAPAEEEAADDV